MREATPLSPVKYLWGRMDAYSLVSRQRSESGEHTFLCTESRASCREKKRPLLILYSFTEYFTMGQVQTTDLQQT